MDPHPMGTEDLVIISDIHVHPWSAFSTGSGLSNSRMRQTLDVLNESLVYAVKHHALWMCAGDIVHTQGMARNAVLNEIIGCMSQYPDLRKLMIWGNHDSRGKGRTHVTVAESVIYAIAEAVPGTIILDNSFYLTDEGLNIYGEGAQPNKEYLGLFGGAGHWLNQAPDVYMGHFTVNDSQTPTGYHLESDISAKDVLDEVPFAIVGDIHHPQIIRWDATEEDNERVLLIPGAPEHHNFGDHGERGFWHVQMGKNEWGWYAEHLVMIPSKSSQFVTLDSSKDIKNDANYYRLTKPLEPGDTLPKNAIVIAPKPTVVEQRDWLVGVTSTKEILQKWMQINKPKGIKDKAALLQCGLDCLNALDTPQIKQARIIGCDAVDFFSYKKMAFSVEEGVTLVTGESRDFKSNGAGKSTIFEAIYWALFGHTTKNVAAGEEIRRGADSCMVHLVLQVGEDLVSIRRARGKRNAELEVDINKEPILGASVSEVNKALLAYLGISEDIYRTLSYYSQEDVMLFSRSTDGQRKEILADLCGLSAYKAARAVAKDEVGVAEDTVGRLTTQLGGCTVRLEGVLESLKHKRTEHAFWEKDHAATVAYQINILERDRKTHADYIATSDQRLTALQIRANKLVVMYAGAQKAKEYSQRYMQALDDVLAKQAKITYTEDATSEALLKLEVSLRPLGAWNDKTGAQLRDFHSEKVIMGAKLQDLLARINELKTYADSATCPTCLQPMDASELEELIEADQSKMDDLALNYKGIETDIENVQTEREELLEEIVDTEAALLKLRHAQRQNIQYISYQKEIEDKQEWLDEKVQEDIADAVMRRTKRLDDRVTKAERIVHNYTVIHSSAVENMEGVVAALELQANPYADTIATLTAQEEELNDEMDGLANILPTWEEQVTIYDYWMRAFSKQGIQSLLLEEVASEFNQARGMIMPLLTNGVIDVQFSTTAQTRSGELREKTDFIITYGDEIVSYNSLSGGQRRRVDLGVMLTLAVANARSRGVSGVLSMLVFDEVFDYLDSDGAEGLFAALNEVQKIIPSVYVITQDSDMRSLFTQTIDVVQDAQGTSTIC